MPDFTRTKPPPTSEHESSNRSSVNSQPDKRHQVLFSSRQLDSPHKNIVFGTKPSPDDNMCLCLTNSPEFSQRHRGSVDSTDFESDENDEQDDPAHESDDVQRLGRSRRVLGAGRVPDSVCVLCL